MATGSDVVNICGTEQFTVIVVILHTLLFQLMDSYTERHIILSKHVEALSFHQNQNHLQW